MLASLQLSQSVTWQINQSVIKMLSVTDNVILTIASEASNPASIAFPYKNSMKIINMQNYYQLTVLGGSKPGGQFFHKITCFPIFTWAYLQT